MDAADESSPTSKRLRSLPPDITVVVSTTEFPCYKLALCFASPYFDTMLSSGMREDTLSRIELPDKDPEEWKEFYKIIDPVQIGEVRTGSAINDDNAVMLTPWFHEFQMEAHLNQCDEVLKKKVESLSGSSCGEGWGRRQEKDFWLTNTMRRRSVFQELMDLLEHSCKFDLAKTINEIELTIGNLMKKSHLRECMALFDVEVVEKLVQLCLPITGNNFRLISSGACKNLWDNHLVGFLAPQRAHITAEKINNNEMFPLLLHSYMQHAALKASRESSLSGRGRHREESNRESSFSGWGRNQERPVVARPPPPRYGRNLSSDSDSSRDSRSNDSNYEHDQVINRYIRGAIRRDSSESSSGSSLRFDEVSHHMDHADDSSSSEDDE